jgi:hypothetical protein
MRGRLTVSVAVVAAVVAVGCGASGDPASDGGVKGDVSGPIRWTASPLRIQGTANLPDDRIVGGTVKNSSLRKVELTAGQLELETADGKRVAGGLAFLDHYAHGVFPPTRREELGSEEERDAEDRRLGRKVTLRPGESRPLTFAWRQPRGAAEPVRVRYPEGWLPIPSGS